MLGLKRRTIKLVPYDLRWQDAFNEEKQILLEVFREDALDIQHVGSTAIIGMIAKPILDIAVIVNDYAVVARHERALNEAGYIRKQDDARTDRLFFAKGSEDNRTHYLHIGLNGSLYIRDMIRFRDALRSSSALANEYAELKQQLAEQHSDRIFYTEGKRKFVEKVLANV